MQGFCHWASELFNELTNIITFNVFKSELNEKKMITGLGNLLLELFLGGGGVGLFSVVVIVVDPRFLPPSKWVPSPPIESAQKIPWTSTNNLHPNLRRRNDDSPSESSLQIQTSRLHPQSRGSRGIPTPIVFLWTAYLMVPNEKMKIPKPKPNQN